MPKTRPILDDKQYIRAKEIAAQWIKDHPKRGVVDDLFLAKDEEVLVDDISDRLNEEAGWRASPPGRDKAGRMFIPTQWL